MHIKHFGIIKYLMLIVISFIFMFGNIFSESLDRLPVIGSIVNVFNTTFFFQYKANEINVDIPNVKYQKEIDDVLNDDINRFTYAIIENFFKEYDDDKYQYTKIDYAIITDNYLWFTLKINVLEIMASGYNYSKYYHINKKSNKIVILDDLFKNKEYKRAINEEIKRQMRSRMKENEKLVYWIDNADQTTDFKTIKDDQKFYFDKKGKLVIVFDQLEVGPGFMGIQEFLIDSKIYEDYLK